VIDGDRAWIYPKANIGWCEAWANAITPNATRRYSGKKSRGAWFVMPLNK